MYKIVVWNGSQWSGVVQDGSGGEGGGGLGRALGEQWSEGFG